MSDNIDLQGTITIKQLIEFAKEYDGNGSNSYEESEFEGAEVVSYILGEIHGINNLDLRSELFDYTRNQLNE